MRGRLDDAPLRIEAPDATSAFRLERRLRHLHAVAVGRGPHWEVDVAASAQGAEDVEPAVQAWLDELGLPETTVWVDGSSKLLRSR